MESTEIKQENENDIIDITMSDNSEGVEQLSVVADSTKDNLKVQLDDLFSDTEPQFEIPKSNSHQNCTGEPNSTDVSDSSFHLKQEIQPSDPEVMKTYYQRLFPWRYLFQWLNHSPVPSNDFGHREFAFTLQNDAYLRYQSFPTSDLIRKDVLRLQPTRFEIGPIYNTNPRDRKTLAKSSAFRPIEKELCFDIDLTDYDDIRTCCEKANICRKCWKFITMAMKVLDVALREDFGYKHILWVYSGRRGAHAWVCDKNARNIDDQKRRAIANYLEIIKGGAKSGKKVNQKRPLHPHTLRSLEILKNHFQNDVLQDQNPWEADEKFVRLLDLLPDRTLNEALMKKWSSAPGRASSAKWADIDTLAKTGASKSLDAKMLLEAKQDIVLEYTYPRLDIEVSKHLNHLLKSPFVIHPGTGRVCVPIDANHCEDFNPLTVPTVTDLLKDIDEWSNTREQNFGESARKLNDWEKTRLKPYIEIFRTFVNLLLKDEREDHMKDETEEMVTTDF
ncbi:BgtA-20577 [Blumeria graminis f. sp. tritici]|uniref:DNA primase n=2 Tax=Blumeria graminis f. sp. tritici TaxID=62690 RepID=A0A9X9QD79_BLUGR|nr:hypothetical protein BGT96224_A20577 [Blumeria graminis f. sp. tritici 96224]VDB88896.1 BgtA-20577 [Blumeria graminis f. sp. tritici]